MNDNDRFAGLGVSALSMTERESVVKLARTILASELRCGPLLAGNRAATAHLQLKSARYEREVFGCLFLTARNRLIEDEELFYGSIDRTSVYPRVILQKALGYNAAGLIMWHNHPSGTAEPSPSDIQLTNRSKHLLEEVDVHLVDHIVVSPTETVSMAARGLI